jgi:BirA family biotin operon repressor/biotin-[acetyl-CoA-carboxylase] ligase
MEVSRLLALNGAPHGTAIAADFQEAGRGRIRGRRWEMEKGNALAFTVLLRFTAGIPVALTLRTGLAVALAIEDFAPTLVGKALLKWPNDILLLDDKGALKAAGILAEAEDGSARIGIGVNLSQKQMPAFLRGKATSVSLAAGKEYNDGDRFILLEKILLRLYDEIEADGVTTAGTGWRERIEARLYKKGEQVCFAKGAADSNSLVTGTLEGIGPDGELLITPRGETGTVAFTAGEIQSNNK